MNGRKNLSIRLAACMFMLALAVVVPVGADTFYVSPGESIQAAINGASYGDIIEVAAGTYHERITFKNGVAVIGTGAAITIINGDAGGSVVVSSGCDVNTVLEGFTITGGSASDGGGMYCNSSSPTVANCTFMGNIAS